MSSPKSQTQSDSKLKHESKSSENSSIPPNRLEELDLNNCVVEIKDLKFSYNKSGKNLLEGFTMTFPRSAIYGFLGPSGCGKTTIIKIICGLLKPKSGTVLVNGRSPKHPDNQIPGPGIGYMPQDICLFDILSINETFTYFARIYGLSAEYTKKRIDFLMEFLELPDKNQTITNLSGGQQRRASLGVAIIHNPPILVLDEPTVGVDPMLRERIWTHLLQLSNEEKTSIMITTHYIDECRKAHVIGLMRNGKLLAESSPNIILTHFKTNNLEKVFLMLCRAEEEKSNALEVPPDLAQMRATTDKKSSAVVKLLHPHHSKPTSWKIFKALLIKNSVVMWRNKLTLLMEIMLPVLTLILFTICIGSKPFDLKVGLNNEEKRNHSVNESLSELFLKNIDKKTVILEEYDSQESAIKAVKDGGVFGVLYVHRNFSNALIERIVRKMNVDDQVINQSTIYYNGDLTDLNIFMTILKTFMEAMMEFVVEIIKMPKLNIMDSLHPNKTNLNVLKPLIEITNPPIYGSNDPLFKEFLLPGIMITTAFLLASALTGLALIEERTKGLLERSLVAGAKMHHISIGMISVHIFVVTLQSILCVVTVYIIIDFKNEGSYVLIIALIVFQCITGMSLGLLISSVADNTKMAIIVVVATIIPFLMISGIVWPIEGMQYDFIRYVSYLLPQTIPLRVLRVITQKGWSLNRFFVWLGYFIPFVWIIVFIVLSVVFSQFRGLV